MTSMLVDGGFTNGRWKTSVEREDLAVIRRMNQLWPMPSLLACNCGVYYLQVSNSTLWYA
jgi:hypothetical protein